MLKSTALRQSGKISKSWRDVKIVSITTILLLNFNPHVYHWKTRSPFQRQLTILQNAINNWYTHRDNISNPSAETLSQTGVSCSYALCVISAKYVSIQRHFYDNRKTANFL